MEHDIGYKVAMVENFHMSFEHSIDPKKRVTIPVSYRQQISQRLKIHNYPEFLVNSVCIVPQTDHMKVYDALGYERKAKDLDPISNIITYWELDKQGRIFIPPNCRRIFSGSRQVLITPSPDLDSIMITPLR